ncbi:MAG: GNAT family N-acetyltransferase [Lentimicrobium sp.]
MRDEALPHLISVRLKLRPFNLADAPEVQRLAGDVDVARNTLAMPFPYADGMAEAWIANHTDDFIEGKSAIWAITLKETDQLIGAIGLNLQLQFSNAEIGYWIGKEYWNNGYCTEALKEVINFGFDYFKLQKMYASYFGNNPASGKVMQKAGMIYEGTLKSHMFHWNEFKDLVQYGVWREEMSNV